jgi:hypothetical protein
MESTSLDEIQAQIDEVPKVFCMRCKTPKHPGLFAPSYLRRPRPVCIQCCKKPRGVAR